jgi:hypothetical protein
LKQKPPFSRILLRNLYVIISSPTIFILYTKYPCASVNSTSLTV